MTTKVIRRSDHNRFRMLEQRTGGPRQLLVAIIVQEKFLWHWRNLVVTRHPEYPNKTIETLSAKYNLYHCEEEIIDD